MATMDGVVRDISPNDEMFQGDETHYFGVGQSAMDCIGDSLRAARLSAADVTCILDLPCGHGRVQRFLRAAFPRAAITACDLLRDGVDYCAATFGAVPAYSAQDPEKVPLDRDAFDLIWVGSLLTHVDADKWADFLQLFRRTLRPNGLLVFSAHGRQVYDRLVRGASDYGLAHWRITMVRRAYEQTGFGYADYLHSPSYGVSLSSPDWVMKQIVRTPEMRVVHASERAWDEHHDIYACIREPQWHVSHPPTPTSIAIKHRLREVLTP